MQTKMQETSNKDLEDLKEDENNTVATDNLHGSQTSGDNNLIIIDGSDEECGNTTTHVNNSACKKRKKVVKGKRFKKGVNHFLVKIGI
jgi:hypothetical protein